MKKKQPTDHDFSLTSGQVVGLIAGQVVIVLLAFVAGLLVGRYDMARELVTLARQGPEEALTAVPLAPPTAPGARTQKPPARTTPPVAKTTATLPGKPPAVASTAKPPAPKKPVTAKPVPAPAKQPAKPAEPEKIQVAAAKKPPVKPAPAPAKKQTAKPAEPEKTQVAAAPAKEGKFTVQVFASRSARVVGNYVAKLQKSGFDAWVNPPKGPNDKWHRTMIGRYPTRSDALKALSELKKKEEFAGVKIFVRSSA